MIKIRSLPCISLLICRGVGDLRKPNYASHVSNLISWIYYDMINTAMIFSGQSDCS